jgi:H+-transporting ATPase
VSDFLTLFSARTSDKFFWQVKPAPILLMGGVTALTLSSLLAVFWPKSTPDGILTEGLKNDMGVFVFVWLFCILFWFVQDLAKVLTWKLLYKYNFNDISSTGVVVLPDSAKKLIADFEAALATSKHGDGGH